MRISTSHFTILCSALLFLTGFSNQTEAQALFTDTFEDRVADQANIGNGWTWFLLTYASNTCTGDDVIFEWGPWSDGDGSDVPAANRNFYTANADGSYYRAGLEVPAWEGALTNMLRVYGDQYLTYATSCERVHIFQEMPIEDAGGFTFSFDVAQSQYGSPENGEVTGAFVKVIKSSDGSYATLLFETIVTTPPAATSPADVSTASQSITFDLADEYVGELLQFGFYNDVTEDLGQSWTTSAANYDNVRLAPVVVAPPPVPYEFDGVPIPAWALFGIAGLLAYFGGSQLRSRKKG